MTESVKQFYTLGSGQPGGPGHILVEGPNKDLCRQAAWDFTEGRFAFGYDTLEEVHPMDRTQSAHLVVDDKEYEVVEGF